MQIVLSVFFAVILFSGYSKQSQNFETLLFSVGFGKTCLSVDLDRGKFSFTFKLTHWSNSTNFY